MCVPPKQPLAAQTTQHLACGTSEKLELTQELAILSDGELSIQETTVRGYKTELALVLTHDEWDDPTNRTIPNAPTWEYWGDVLEGVFTDQPQAAPTWICGSRPGRPTAIDSPAGAPRACSGERQI